MATVVDSEEWHILFECYKDLPQLWQIKSDCYKNRDKRNKAWSQLLRLYQCIVPNATLDALKSRITNIRTCYRRELKKVKESEKSGAGADDVYVPTLWYFYHLDFLKDQEEPVMGTSSMDNFEGGERETDDECGSQHRPNRKQARLSHDTRQEFLAKAIDHLDNESRKIRDEADVYGESWAFGFRKLTTEQKLYAKKAIDDILLLGQLQKLTLDTVNIQRLSSGHSSNEQSASALDPGPPTFSPQPPYLDETTGNESYEPPATAPLCVSPVASSSQTVYYTSDIPITNISYANFQELFNDVQFS